MSDDQPFFLKKNEGFAEISTADELLHPLMNNRLSDDSVTETQYLGFSVPEENIHAIGYCWHHPNLKVVTGGVFAWQGIKRNTPAAELCDVRAFMKDTALAKDLHEYRLDNGYGVKVIEPLKHLHMTYADAERQNSIDLHYEAVAPPVMFGSGCHFEQPMRVRGDLVLRGKKYQVDCYNVRDRSWGKTRPENNMPMPPYSWATAVFNEKFSFNCSVFDQAEGNPELAGTRFALPVDRTLSGGWLIYDGVLGCLTSVQKRVVRDPVTRWPLSAELDMTDDRGRTVKLRGKMISACPWQVWPNLIFLVALMHWTCEGMDAYGDFQEGFWNDYLNEFVKG